MAQRLIYLLRHIRDVLDKAYSLDQYDKVRMLFFFARRSPTKEFADYYLEWIRKLSPEAHDYIINKYMTVFSIITKLLIILLIQITLVNH